MNLIQSTFPLLDSNITINVTTTIATSSTTPTSTSPKLLLSNHQPLIWVQQMNGPGNADLISLTKPFRVHPCHHSNDIKVKLSSRLQDLPLML
jgi:hypothetical protein